MSNYGTYGAAAGSIFGAFTASMQIDAQNDALKAQAQFNEDMYKAQEVMTKFSQDNNQEMLNNIQKDIEAETSESVRNTNVQADKAVSKTVIKRGEGITAGNSTKRSVDNIIKQADMVKAGIITSSEQKASNLYNQVLRENQTQQVKLINSYNNMKLQNEQIAGQVISGFDAALKIGQSAIGQSMQGYKLGESINGMIESMPEEPKPIIEDPYNNDLYNKPFKI